jgi:hypothetical protein
VAIVADHTYANSFFIRKKQESSNCNGLSKSRKDIDPFLSNAGFLSIYPCQMAPEKSGHFDSRDIYICSVKKFRFYDFLGRYLMYLDYEWGMLSFHYDCVPKPMLHSLIHVFALALKRLAIYFFGHKETSHLRYALS